MILTDERYRDDGSKSEETYTKVWDGYVVSRQVFFFPDGKVSTDEWTRDGLHHRIDGPVTTTYLTTGEFFSWSWALNGDFLMGREVFVEALRSFDEDHLAGEYAASSFAPLIREGHSAVAIREAFAAGATTVEGIRAVLEGAPSEWAVSFESGATS